jgi:hypothetical protein
LIGLAEAGALNVYYGTVALLSFELLLLFRAPHWLEIESFVPALFVQTVFLFKLGIVRGFIPFIPFFVLIHFLVFRFYSVDILS